MEDIKYSLNKFKGATSVVIINVDHLHRAIYTNGCELDLKSHFNKYDVDSDYLYYIPIRVYEEEQRELDEFIKENLL